MMYNIKISFGVKTINHNNIKTLSKCYSIIMTSYRQLKSNEHSFSILLYNNDGKILRVTNKYIMGVGDVARRYVDSYIS